jgi:DNA-binding MarR family transcriptional regulator
MTDTFLTRHDDKELEILRSVSLRERIRQRDLALVAGMSLGMTNAILKRLVTRGLLTMRRINSRKILYAVSPAGREEIARRSYSYFKRTLRNIVYYKNSIDELVRGLKAAGYSRVCLVGFSDVDFIVEHFCGKYGLAYGQETDDNNIEAGSFILYGENADRPKPSAPDGRRYTIKSRARTGMLRDILVRN